MSATARRATRAARRRCRSSHRFIASTSLDDAEPWTRACAEGWEGVIAKRLDSPYEQKRSKHWLKMKCELTQDFVVGGFTDPQGGRVGLGALLVGLLSRATISSSRARSALASTRNCLTDLRARLDAIEIPNDAVHEGDGTSARAPTLGAAGDRRARRVHRVDRPREAPPFSAARGVLGSSPARTHATSCAPRRSPDAPITHPEKVMFPDDGITKGELAAYYERRRAAHAAASERAAGDHGALSSRHRREGVLSEERVRQGRSVVARDASPCRRRTASSTIRSCATSAGSCGSRIRTASRRTCGRRARPTSCIPTSASSISIRSTTTRTRYAPRRCSLRDLLAELGCTSWVKTSGSKGFHVVDPARRHAPTPDRSRASRMRVGRALVRRDPAHLTQEFYKADRGGRILIDTGRNEFGATYAATYAVRPKPTRAGLRAVHVGRDRERPRRAADVHASLDGVIASTTSATCGQISTRTVARCPIRPELATRHSHIRHSSSQVRTRFISTSPILPKTTFGIHAAKSGLITPLPPIARVSWIMTRKIIVVARLTATP